MKRNSFLKTLGLSAGPKKTWTKKSSGLVLAQKSLGSKKLGLAVGSKKLRLKKACDQKSLGLNSSCFKILGLADGSIKLGLKKDQAKNSSGLLLALKCSGLLLAQLSSGSKKLGLT